MATVRVDYRLAGVFLSLVVIGGISACQPATVKAPDDGKVHIAVVGPMSGQFSVFDEQLRLGASEAVARLNDAGGVLGKPIALEVLDDRCDPALAVRVAQEAVGNGVVFVDGHFCSGSSIPASDVYERSGIVQITPASTDPTLTERGKRNVFRVVGRDEQQGRFAADEVIDRGLGNQIAVVHDGSAYGELLARSFEARLEERGWSPVVIGTLGRGARDATGLLDTLRERRVDLIYFGGFSTEAGMLAREADAAGLKLRLVGADALIHREFWVEAGPAGEGTLMVLGANPRKDPAAREVVSRFRSRGINPEGRVLYAYGAVQVWAEAVERAGTTEAAAVVAALHTGTYPSVLGELAFDAKGDRASAPAYEMYRWHAGQYGPVSD